MGKQNYLSDFGQIMISRQLALSNWQVFWGVPGMQWLLVPIKSSARKDNW